MKETILYKYRREDGGTTVSPVKPDSDYETMLRIEADDGYILTDGQSMTFCADVESADGWSEVEAPEEEEEDRGDQE
jgi:hypothetical protein